jgi:hypothetical protein
MVEGRARMPHRAMWDIAPASFAEGCHPDPKKN